MMEDTHEMQELAQKRFEELHTEGSRLYGVAWMSANLAVNRIAQQDYVPTVGFGNIHPAIKCVLTETAMVIARERHEAMIEANKLQADLKAAQKRIAALEAENERLTKALTYYADSLKYENIAWAAKHTPFVPILEDNGAIAREALQPAKERQS